LNDSWYSDIKNDFCCYRTERVCTTVYHGFMQPILVQDLQLISPVPLDLMLMSFKTLQRRWWVAQPPPYTRTIEIYLLVAWLLKERFNGPASSCKPGIISELC
jgi:hypothetical protein